MAGNAVGEAARSDLIREKVCCGVGVLGGGRDVVMPQAEILVIGERYYR